MGPLPCSSLGKKRGRRRTSSRPIACEKSSRRLAFQSRIQRMGSAGRLTGERSTQEMGEAEPCGSAPRERKGLCLPKPGHRLRANWVDPKVLGVSGRDGWLPCPWLLDLSLDLSLSLSFDLSLSLFASLVASPCCRANELTHCPMPCTPRRAALALQSATSSFTCWPQLV